MRETRIYHPQAVQDHTEVVLSGTGAHHLTRVLRLQQGAHFTLFDGSGREWPATLVDTRSGTVMTGAGVIGVRESPLSLTLVQGISRGERMDWTIQKAVELGVAKIIPVFTGRTTVKLDARRAERRTQHWETIIISACEQCGRARLPVIAAPMDLAAWLETRAQPAFVLARDAALPLARAWPTGTSEAAVIVGPEGGLADDELALAQASGCTAVRLGPRVLRTETAGLVALSAIQALFGDLAD